MSIKKKKLKNGETRHVVYYRDDGGRLHEKSFRTKAEATRFETATRDALYRGEYVNPAAGKQTFRDYAEQWRLNAPHEDTTAAAVETRLRKHVYPTIGHRAIGSIRSSDIQGVVTAATQNLAPATVHVVYAHIKTIFNRAVIDRVIARTPCEAISLPKIPKKKVVPLAPEVVHRIVQVISERFTALVIVAIGTGMRQGELFGLKIQDVDFEEQTIRVYQQVQTVKGPPRLKGLKTDGSYRTIPVTAFVLDAIRGHIERYGLGPDGVVFTGRTGKLLRRSSFHSVWMKVADELDLPERSGLHMLRHFYASMLIRDGHSVKVVQERLGHKSATETLDTYAHLFEDHADRTRDTLDGFFGSHPTHTDDSPSTEDAA